MVTAPGEVTNTARVTAANDSTDNKDGSTTVIVGALPTDVELVSKRGPENPTRINQTFNYVITVRDKGPLYALGAVIADDIPEGLEVVATILRDPASTARVPCPVPSPGTT